MGKNKCSKELKNKFYDLNGSRCLYRKFIWYHFNIGCGAPPRSFWLGKSVGLNRVKRKPIQMILNMNKGVLLLFKKNNKKYHCVNNIDVYYE